jgi:flavin-dependent dehydrogenase
VAPLIEGSEVKEYSAHLIPEGGYKAIPQLFGDGWLVVGDAAQLNNAIHREGSNLAMMSGQIAGEAIFQVKSRRDPMTAGNLALYKTMIDESFVIKDLKKYKDMPGAAAYPVAKLLPHLSATGLEGDAKFRARRRYAQDRQGEAHAALLREGALLVGSVRGCVPSREGMALRARYFDKVI